MAQPASAGGIADRDDIRSYKAVNPEEPEIGLWEVAVHFRQRVPRKYQPGHAGVGCRHDMLARSGRSSREIGYARDRS
jgi:hypothetical protein